MNDFKLNTGREKESAISKVNMFSGNEGILFVQEEYRYFQLLSERKHWAYFLPWRETFSDLVEEGQYFLLCDWLRCRK